MNTVQISCVCADCVFNLPVYIPRSEIAGSRGNISEDLPDCFPQWPPHLTFPPTVYECSNFSVSSSALVTVCLLGFKELLFLGSFPPRWGMVLGRIWGWRGALQFTPHPEGSPQDTPLSPLLSPGGATVKINGGGKGSRGLGSSHTPSASRRGTPRHAALSRLAPP